MACLKGVVKESLGQRLPARVGFRETIKHLVAGMIGNHFLW